MTAIHSPSFHVAICATLIAQVVHEVLFRSATFQLVQSYAKHYHRTSGWEVALNWTRAKASKLQHADFWGLLLQRIPAASLRRCAPLTKFSLCILRTPLPANTHAIFITQTIREKQKAKTVATFIAKLLQRGTRRQKGLPLHT